MISVKVYLIITTMVTVVNGKTIDKIDTSYPTSHSSYSECKNSIKSKKNSYSSDYKSHKRNKDKNFTYKKIKCKSKNIKTSEILNIENFIKL